MGIGKKKKKHSGTGYSTCKGPEVELTWDTEMSEEHGKVLGGGDEDGDDDVS